MIYKRLNSVIIVRDLGIWEVNTDNSNRAEK